MDRTPRTIDEWDSYRLVYTGICYEVQKHWTSPDEWEALSPEGAMKALALRLEEQINATAA